MRRLITTAALLTAALLSPRAGVAQRQTYHFGGYGTLIVPGPSPTGGCGTYVCLTLEAGALSPAVQPPPLNGLGSSQGLYVRQIGSAMLPAFAQIGGSYFVGVVTGVEQYVACISFSPGTVNCDRDSYALQTGVNAPTPPGPGEAIGLLGVLQPGSSYLMSLSNTVTIDIFNAAGVQIASDTFVPTVVVTPEPTTLALTLGGIAVIGGAARRRAA